MDNYKIINTHTNEIIKTLNELGYVWTPKKFDEQDCLLKAHWILAEETGEIAYSSGTHIDYPLVFKETTLPQLRDLVVLHRNNVKDANYKLFISPSQGYLSLYKASDDVFYAYAEKSKCWDKSRAVDVNTKDLEPIDIEHASEEKAPALISGADALRALADGKEVECKNKVSLEWFNCLSLSVAELVEGSCQYRIKNQPIRVELELPETFEPQYYEVFYFIDPTVDRGYSVARHSMNHKKYLQFGAYSTEDDVKKAVEQLRKIRGAS